MANNYPNLSKVLSFMQLWMVWAKSRNSAKALDQNSPLCQDAEISLIALYFSQLVTWQAITKSREDLTITFFKVYLN